MLVKTLTSECIYFKIEKEYEEIFEEYNIDFRKYVIERFPELVRKTKHYREKPGCHIERDMSKLKSITVSDKIRRKVKGKLCFTCFINDCIREDIKTGTLINYYKRDWVE